jgi:hypothetical protein
LTMMPCDSGLEFHFLDNGIEAGRFHPIVLYLMHSHVLS